MRTVAKATVVQRFQLFPLVCKHLPRTRTAVLPWEPSFDASSASNQPTERSAKVKHQGLFVWSTTTVIVHLHARTETMKWNTREMGNQLRGFFKKKLDVSKLLRPNCSNGRLTGRVGCHGVSQCVTVKRQCCC